MNVYDFYYDRKITSIEWWLEWAYQPGELKWARLRMFDNETADVCFGPGMVAYGFHNRTSAAHFLSEDEYSPLAAMNEEDRREYALIDFAPPKWTVDCSNGFRYLGIY